MATHCYARKNTLPRNSPFHGMATHCYATHGEKTGSSPCGKACLFKSLTALVAQHGAVSELLEWGVTDFNLWQQVISLAKPTPDGLGEDEFAEVFHLCAMLQQSETLSME